MLNHVMVGTNDIARARAFYDAVLGGVFGAPAPFVNQAASGHTRLFYRHAGSTFCVSEPINDEPASPGNGATVGFKCDSPEQVQHFHDSVVAAGGISIEKPPGLRESSMGPTWLAYVRDPDGNKLRALYRPA
ncbi:VOC family protein [Xanthomonas axonopodis pv. begoniae]|uniref:VOC family protein n=1 Tax=Xanthomonas phaseoli TaxID=1985254 RepID=UPI000CEE7962|nr:VOC family protein [Xanthomonas phaseoli]MBO9741280.1 VOC family protein [Xanthomonas axonopodis pv. begoniae]MBO9773602.1 VOC family protein [Xanthomonas axonopodis pv. begoniae]MCC8469468.1 VOC family protein [Xanthomonas phaseoli]PPT29913.1 glyoxalase [Xanthomonas axonopodis pv. begoniae]